MKKIVKIINQYSKPIFFVIATLLLAFMLSISKDYGISNDEAIHQLHGELLYDYYFNGKKTAALSPFDEDGKIIKTVRAIENEKIRGMNFFGGFFDLIVNIVHSIFPDYGIYDLRHLINALFGFLIFVFISLIIKGLFGWKWAVFALIFSVLIPRLFGHSFINPKDIPFAAFYIIGIYLIINHFKNEKLSVLNTIFLILSIGISISIRVSGLLLIFYFFAAYFIFKIPYSKDFKSFFSKSKLKKHFKSLMLIGLISLIAYLSTALFWPYMQNDLLAPIKVLTKVSDFEVFNAYELFAGKWYNAWELSRWYVPVWLFITLPAFAIIGFLAIPIIFYHLAYNEKVVKVVVFLFLSFLFPVLYIIILKSNIYNGIRHLLFVIPPFVTISIIAWKYLLQLSKNTSFYFLSRLTLSIFILFTAYKMIKIHPYQSIYFNEVIGGGEGAAKNFETDYWGISAKEAVYWIDENINKNDSLNKPIKIKMFYGDNDKVSYYTKQIDGLEYVYGNPKINYDYEIVYASVAKFNKKLIKNWPPKNSIKEIYADGAPLCAIVKNELTNKSLDKAKNDYQKFLDFYKDKNYAQAVYVAKKHLTKNPDDALMLNNMGSALNSIGMYRLAEEYLGKALTQNEDFKLAKNNLDIATKNKESIKKNDLLKFSVISYKLGYYNKSANYCKKIIEKYGDDKYAYNNMCSAYNALGKYELAIKYCEKALAIDSEFKLAKNNLSIARRKLSSQ